MRSDFAWSPDGRRFALVGVNAGDIVVDADGSEERRILAIRLPGGLAWSSDGTKLLLTARPDSAGSTSSR